jgi:hypothetical protein
MQGLAHYEKTLTSGSTLSVLLSKVRTRQTLLLFGPRGLKGMLD